MRKLLFCLLLVIYSFGYSQTSNCPLSVLADDLVDASDDFKNVINTKQGFNAYQVLNLAEETKAVRIGKDALDNVSDHLTATSKENDVLAEEIKNAGGFHTWKVANVVVKNLDDLKLWAKNNGLENLTDVEIKGTFDLFEGNISFSQKALLSTKEIISGKNLDELAFHFNLPINPSVQSLTPYKARIWYSWRKFKISSLVDKSNGLEFAAREAVNMRNSIRTGARESMLDTDIADYLNTKEVNKTFDDLYNDKSKLFSNQDDIYNAIIESSMKGRGAVDILYKIPK